MVIKKILVKNYKIFNEKVIEFNDNINIFVGANDAGKSTILELISIVTTGKLNGYAIDKQINTNLFNNVARKAYNDKIANNESPQVPEIVIEAYCKNDEKYSEFKGTNNSLGEDCPGVLFKLTFNTDYSINYKEQLKQKEIIDIPLEFYKTEFKTFDGNPILIRKLPFKTAIIDTSKKDYYNLVNKFINDNIGQFLTAEDEVNLRTEYRKNQLGFNNTTSIVLLNQKLKDNVKINDKNVSINIKESNIDKWKEDMEISVEEIPFTNIGFGTQNIIKMELALKNDIDSIDTIIIEEPENNLSYCNMAKLISKIELNKGKQIFISSHSSFVANKLGLDNICIICNGEINRLSNLNEETKMYFRKLPGYDTLRVILANKVILVEGATDDLIVQRAYFDNFGKLPIEDGVDVITVDSLAFKRYCDIALLVNKKVKIITDNDGNIEENILNKYKDYIENENIEIYYEPNESLHTLELSVINANMQDGKISDIFRKAISSNNSMASKTNEEIEKFMLNNKTEWSMRVFDFSESIKYPQYIMNAIEK